MQKQKRQRERHIQEKTQKRKRKNLNPQIPSVNHEPRTKQTEKQAPIYNPPMFLSSSTNALPYLVSTNPVLVSYTSLIGSPLSSKIGFPIGQVRIS
jgi:hypothetical protein